MVVLLDVPEAAEIELWALGESEALDGDTTEHALKAPVRAIATPSRTRR